MNTRILHNAGEHRYHVAAAIAIVVDSGAVGSGTSKTPCLRKPGPQSARLSRNAADGTKNSEPVTARL